MLCEKRIHLPVTSSPKIVKTTCSPSEELCPVARQRPSAPPLGFPSFNNLASFYYAQGKYAEAEPLYRRALAIFEKALGPEHLDVARSLENYAKLLRKTNRKAEAAKMEVRAKAIRTKHAAKNPPK